MIRILLIAALLMPLPVAAESLRVASFNASLARKGPGMLIRDLGRDNRQIAQVVAILQTVRPDILLVNEIDWDPDGIALRLFAEALSRGPDGIAYPHRFTTQPNTGFPSGHDQNRDGKIGGPDDAHGYGAFPGQYGMALLSRYPIDAEAARSFARFLWPDLPGARMPTDRDGAPFPSAEAAAERRLSSKSHWDVPVMVGETRLHILASHPTPPVFDGPEDRNGLRNADEIRFWVRYLDGAVLADDQGRAAARGGGPFVVMGDLNADPADGDGVHSAISALLAHPTLQDPEPRSAGGIAAAASGGANDRHRGDPALDTADWRDKPGPGNLRVDYVLPSADLSVTGSGVFWPEPGAEGAELLKASDHRLVWVDIALP